MKEKEKRKSGFVFTVYSLQCNIMLLQPCLMIDVLHTLFLFSMFFWCPCMVINVVSVQYNGGFLPDIILLTQCYYHNRGTRLNAMKRFCICSL